MRVVRYYDAHTAAYQTVECTAIRSMAGRVGGVEYRVSYRLRDGRWLNGLRHHDRGDLMTDAHIASKPWISCSTAPNDGMPVGGNHA